VTAEFPNRFEKSAELAAPATAVFERLDDFTRLGEHMMRSSWMMAGSRMSYDFDSARGKAVGARVRLQGSFLGIKLIIDEQVDERTPPRTKSWQTIGHPRMIVLDAYRMGFSLTPLDTGCRLMIFIDYATPSHGFRRWIARIAAAWYARWCVISMLDGAIKHFGPTIVDAGGRPSVGPARMK
jgi:hypothetical protein